MNRMNFGEIAAKVIVSLFICAMLAVMIPGCTINDEAQMKAIANQAGLFSAVGWIAIDNPSVEIKTAVKGVVTLIAEKAIKLEDGETYTEVLYPDVIKYIDEKMEEKDRPLAKAGSLALLSGIDILFAVNPKWKEDQTIVVNVIQSFCDGANTGLSMSSDDPVIKAAKASAALRSELKLNN